MIHPNDLDAFTRITKHGALTPEFEQTYMLWHAAQQRNNISGPLGPLMVPLLASLGMLPAPEIPKIEKVRDWTDIKLGSRVMVNDDPAPAPGTYLGLGSFGILHIRLDGNPMIREFPPHQVTLLPEEFAVEYIPEHPGVPDAQYAPDEHDGEFHNDEEFPTYHNGMDEPAKEPPKVDKKWLDMESGSPVKVKNGHKKQKPAEFVRIGPEDGQITVYLDGTAKAVKEQEVVCV
jgi:hypothetical protein